MFDKPVENQQPRRLVGVVDLKFRTEGIALP